MKSVILEMERLRNPFSGLGQFCLNLGKSIATNPEAKDLDLTYYIPDNQAFTTNNNLKFERVSKWHKAFPLRGNFDIWHCLHQDSKYLPQSKKTKLILTIHDLNFLERNDYSNFRKILKINALQRKINRSSAITYISNFTKNVVHSQLKIPKNVVEKVIYNGNNILSESLSEKPFFKDDFLNKNDNFVFSIGIIQPKKNFHVVLPILEQRKELKWIIAGDDSGEYATIIHQKAVEMGVESRVLFLGKVQEKEKQWLFENCLAFVFPSLSEGFGMPVIEAMSFGKPVFLSRLTSLPEIGGDLAYYFDDFGSQTIINTFELGMKEYEMNARKSALIKQHAARFSWQNAADEYINLYKSL